MESRTTDANLTNLTIKAVLRIGLENYQHIARRSKARWILRGQTVTFRG
jgi:hypothetical protein